MVAKSKKSTRCAASSSSISCTSNNSSSGFVDNEPLVKVSAIRKRRGRSPKTVGNEKEEKRRGRRPPKKGGNEEEEKRTIMSWIMNSNIIQDCAKVCYRHNNDNHQPVKVGKITRVGIICDCCNQVLTVENFQYHAVREVNRPYEHIVVMDMNTSLMDCMAKAWELPSERKRSKFNLIKGAGRYKDKYDDACMICADGGELMCCDSEKCHSTHHHRCLDMEDVPTNDWYCPYCVCKLCNNLAREEERVYTCLQCEKKYHWECHRDSDFDINQIPIFPFCEQGCKEIYEKLETMVGVRNNLEGLYTWTLLRRMDKEDFAAGTQDLYVRNECHSKLAVAWSLMKDCFEPITDRHTKIDVIQSILYNCGSNYTRINFRGFYTAVLEKDGEIISVASLRIHGTKLAEMPLIATNAIHRRKGMCRKLMSAIESVLCLLNVGYLIIPSVRRKEKTWKEGYNFTRLNVEMKKEIMCYNTLMFHDSVRLQKVLLPPDNGQGGRDVEINAGSRSRNLGVDLNQELIGNSES